MSELGTKLTECASPDHGPHRIGELADAMLRWYASGVDGMNNTSSSGKAIYTCQYRCRVDNKFS